MAGITKVLKFGGSLLKELPDFEKIANKIFIERGRSDRLVVVVSAMKGETDRLLNLAHAISGNPPKRETDMLISVGERISMSLLAIALSARNIPCISFTGSQAGIITSNDHCDADVLDIKPLRITQALDEGKVVIVAGFQGVSQDREITTLGRGGSDTTAAILAVKLKADCIEYYKDVGGIFHEDPHVFPETPRFEKINYAKLMQLVSKSKVQVVHPKALELSYLHNIKVLVKGLKDETKTEIVNGKGN